MYINKFRVCIHKSMTKRHRQQHCMPMCARELTHTTASIEIITMRWWRWMYCVCCGLWMHSAYIKTMCDVIQSAEHLTDYSKIQISFRFDFHSMLIKLFYSFQRKRSHQFLFTKNKQMCVAFFAILVLRIILSFSLIQMQFVESNFSFTFEASSQIIYVNACKHF